MMVRAQISFFNLVGSRTPHAQDLHRQKVTGQEKGGSAGRR